VVTALALGRKKTDWPVLFRAVLALNRPSVEIQKQDLQAENSVPSHPQKSSSHARKCTIGRYLLTILLFLLTRLLIPNQILENRGYMTRLYSERRGTYVRLLLRYDMLLPWKKYGNHYLVVPAEVSSGVPPPLEWNKYDLWRPLYPNVWASLLTPPKEGFVTKTVGEKLRHHVTELDGYLLIRDEEVDNWGDNQLVVKLGSVICV
jgi:hypothetical protein